MVFALRIATPDLCIATLERGTPGLSFGTWPWRTCEGRLSELCSDGDALGGPVTQVGDRRSRAHDPHCHEIEPARGGAGPRSRIRAELPRRVPFRVPDVGSALASDPNRRAQLGSPIRGAGEGHCPYQAIGSPRVKATLHRMGVGREGSSTSAAHIQQGGRGGPWVECRSRAFRVPWFEVESSDYPELSLYVMPLSLPTDQCSRGA